MTTREATKQLYFEDVSIGDEVTPLVKGPMSPLHLMRWSAAIENWHRIHYDETFSKEHDGLPERLVNGSWKQHVLVQMMKDWVGLGGWLWKIGFQFRAMDVVWSTVTAWGRVVDTRRVGDFGVVECEIGMRNEEGQESTPGTATVVLPLRDGPTVPYPFVPPAEE
ncbi:MAG TPA: acyl dehydratase [Dehalococcoidia bacterium]|nr:acyl dehydratase [Dehalococcoidia bacterium]